MKLREKVSLQKLNTMRLASVANFLVTIENGNDLIEAVFFLRKNKLPFLILGGGSNLLLSETVLSAVVLQNEITSREMSVIDNNSVRVSFGSGENWDKAVAFTVKNNLSGLENLSGIPGTVGGAVVQNAGAYGVEIKEVVESVEVFDLTKMENKVILASDCGFGYRQSNFKTPEWRKYFITKVNFVLKANGPVNLVYKDLQEYFLGKTETPKLAEVRQAVLEIRQNKLPDLETIGSVGSFFKNPVVEGIDFLKLKERYNDLPSYQLPNGKVKIPLAYILDKICGLKGLRSGNVGLYEKQPLIICNFGDATAEEIRNLENKISVKVFEKTGLKIEREAEEIKSENLHFLE